MINLEKFDFPYEVKELQGDGTFVGMGSPFGGPPDKGGDVVVEGAFAKSITNGGPNGDGKWPFLWHHDPREPIGVISEAKEMKTGLKVIGQYALEAQRGHDAYIMAKLGATSQLSIGYRTLEEEFDHNKVVRYLKSVDWMELSQVTFGMAGRRARLTRIKSLQEAKTARELEHALRDEGLSWSVAKQIVALCRPALRDEGKERTAEFKDLLAVLRKQRAEAMAYRAVRL